jgi:adenylosuccinate synthase
LAKQILILTGQVSSGKTTLSNNLARKFGFRALKTKEYLARLAGPEVMERGAMQQLGQQLDEDTRGEWVRDALLAELNNLGPDARVVVDAARIPEQIEAIRRALPQRVVHIHLHAPVEELSRRYVRRPQEAFKEFASYDEVGKNRTESHVSTLAETADVVIDTTRCTESDVVVRAAAHLGLYARQYLPLVDVLVGGEYGSEGKGHVASYIAPEYDVLVRVGGPNAGHTVLDYPGTYIFHHLPSGSKVSRADLIIGPGAVVNVNGLLKEIADCAIAPERLSIAPQVMIIEAEDRHEETQLVRDISSTGSGVGAATARRIMGRSKNLVSPKVRLARDIAELGPFIRDTQEILERAFAQGKKVLLEGTQGAGLSLYHGKYPHVTSRDTTVGGTLAEAGISPRHVRRIVMVCRTYPIRVGNAPETGESSGYMSQPITWSQVSERSGIPIEELTTRERTSTTKRERRVGEFDWELIRRSAYLNGPTDIALTFTDYINQINADARRFEQLTDETIRFINEIERVTSATVSLISTRFHSRSIIDRRTW